MHGGGASLACSFKVPCGAVGCSEAGVGSRKTEGPLLGSRQGSRQAGPLGAAGRAAAGVAATHQDVAAVTASGRLEQRAAEIRAADAGGGVDHAGADVLHVLPYVEIRAAVERRGEARLIVYKHILASTL